MKESLNLHLIDETNIFMSSSHISNTIIVELKAARKTTANNNGLVVTGFPALHPNCHGFVGHACVSVHIRPVSTHSHCSFGHSPYVHGTPAQYYVATSPSLHVVRHVWVAQMQNTKHKKAAARNQYRRPKTFIRERIEETDE